LNILCNDGAPISPVHIVAKVGQFLSLLAAQARVDASQLALRRLTDEPRLVDINVAKAQVSLAEAQLDEALHSVDRTNAKIAELNVNNAKNTLYMQQLTRDANQQRKEDLLKDPRTAPQANQLPSDTSENANLTSREFDVQIAQANLEAQQTRAGNVGSIASAQAQLLSAQHALAKLLEGGNEQDIKRAQANLSSAQVTLEQAKVALDKRKLLAPFDGVVARMNLHLGAQSPTGIAVVLLDTSSFYVDLPVDQLDIAKIAMNQAVNLKFDALPGTILPGKVTRIGQVGTKSGNVVTYTIRIELDSADPRLRSAMTATANIVTGKVSNIVRIPNRFVRVDRTTGKTYTSLRQPDGSYKEIEITLGLRSDTISEVKRGLKAGDVVTLPEFRQSGS
jgi:RND family efflux transporter MFP subunit